MVSTLSLYSSVVFYLYNLENPEAWHEEVSLHSVRDARTGLTLGYFFMDLHPRDGKYGHAAMWDLQPGSLDRHGRRQKAVAAMVCNFPRPSATTPSLLEHKQVGGKTTFIITSLQLVITN